MISSSNAISKHSRGPCVSCQHFIERILLKIEKVILTTASKDRTWWHDLNKENKLSFMNYSIPWHTFTYVCTYKNIVTGRYQIGFWNSHSIPLFPVAPIPVQCPTLIRDLWLPNEWQHYLLFFWLSPLKKFHQYKFLHGCQT
jgi:hypothetical protein